LLTILLFAAGIATLYIARAVALTFILAILLAYLIDPVVRFLQSHSLFFRNLRGPHVLEAYLAFLLCIVFIGHALAPRLGANVTAMAAIGAIRDNAQTIQNQINNLEQDSLSSDPNLNTEVSVLNKINAANVLTLRTLQDSNKLLLSLLGQNVIAAKQQRETTANSINTDIARQASLAGNMAQVTSTLNSSLQNFRMP
jgi:predicted PurR-regulated permease PerM